jgi:hypothetical protein
VNNKKIDFNNNRYQKYEKLNLSNADLINIIEEKFQISPIDLKLKIFILKNIDHS